MLSTKPSLAQVDRTVQCTHCTQNNITPPYVSYHLPIAKKPLYCPKCRHQRIFNPYSYVDVLCTDHAGLSIKQACKIINLYNEQRDRGTLRRKTLTLDPIDYFNDMGVVLPSLRESFSPLNVSCKDCGGSYTLLRNVPDVNKTPPLYCVWCASNQVTVTTQSTDEMWWESLALAYNLPINMLKVFYDRWTTHSNKSTFKDYMESDMIKGLLEGLVTA